MSGVVMRRLGDVAEMYQPKTLSRKDLVSTGPFAVYGANGIIGRHDAFNHEDPQILISCRGTCGRVLRSEPRSWINGNAMVVRSIEESLSFDYLELVLRHSVDLESAINGVAQPQITRSSLEPLELPLPPLDEQRRIAETLDTADGIRRRHLQARDEAKALLAALSAREFTRLEEDASVPKVRLGDVAEVRAGATPRRSKADYFGGSIAWVKIGDMETGFVHGTDEMITQKAVDDHRIRIHGVGTILISIFATIGRVAELAVPAGTNQAIVAVLPKVGMLRNPYLRWMLRDSVETLKSQAKGVAQANINGTVLKDTVVPLPPLDDQRRIAETLDTADALARRHQAAADEAAALLASLSHDIFTRLEQEARRESA